MGPPGPARSSVTLVPSVASALAHENLLCCTLPPVAFHDTLPVPGPNAVVVQLAFVMPMVVASLPEAIVTAGLSVSPFGHVNDAEIVSFSLAYGVVVSFALTLTLPVALQCTLPSPVTRVDAPAGICA